MAKTERNKTLATPLEAGGAYLSRCVTLTDAAPLAAVENRTVLGDMLQVCPLLPEKCVDLLIADPPYNLTKTFANDVFSRRSEDEYEAYTRRWLQAVRPLLKDDATVYVCCDWASGLTVGRVLAEFFTVRNRITWQREKGRGAERNWKNGMEDVWFATVGDAYAFRLDAVRMRRRVIAPYREDGAPKDWIQTPEGRFRDTCPSNFWDDVTVPFWSMPENTAHPTQKPEKLLAKLILASSDPGDLVLDPFLGSGTTSVTAKKLGRRYVGIEAQPQYCVWAEQRLERADTDPSIQGYADGVFWERHSHAAQEAARKKNEKNK